MWPIAIHMPGVEIVQIVDDMGFGDKFQQALRSI